jgi:two-component system, response regulator PdtaR
MGARHLDSGATAGNELEGKTPRPLGHPAGTKDQNVRCLFKCWLVGLSGMTVVLTVEDDALVGEYLGHVLRLDGHDVIATANADEAIAVLETRNDIRIVITDVNLSGSMDGLRLAAAVKDRWPPVRIIITTGQGRPSDDLMPAGSEFVAKPYMPEKILATVRHFQ